MDNPQERLAFDLGWLVGIIDGEGSFMILTRTKGDLISAFPCINIDNTNLLIIERAQRIIKELGLACYVQFKPKKVGKNSWSLQVRGVRRVASFLEKVGPFFECRAAQARLLQRYVQSRLGRPKGGKGARLNEYELEIMGDLRELNRSRHESSETIRSALQAAQVKI